MNKRLLKKFIPRAIRAPIRDYRRAIWVTVENYKILSLEVGQFKTILRRECIDKDGNPIPWYTYPAIEYIKQLDVSEKTIFEYGSGNSTMFWAHRCQKVISIENKRMWYEKIKGQLPNNVEYLCLENKKEYIEAIGRYSNEFDIIIIDGNYRFECASVARNRLSHDGFIILDNSDWREKTSELLRKSDLIEVDMSGFGPINRFTTTTSFYFTRNVKLEPAHGRQPTPGIGSIKQTWDT
ncbi:MAG: SAM-dependent methyltransferase [Gammaproteobacteria bacterium]|jgi:hypothetical protein